MGNEFIKGGRVVNIPEQIAAAIIDVVAVKTVALLMKQKNQKDFEKLMESMLSRIEKDANDKMNDMEQWLDGVLDQELGEGVKESIYNAACNIACEAYKHGYIDGWQGRDGLLLEKGASN